MRIGVTIPAMWPVKLMIAARRAHHRSGRDLGDDRPRVRRHALREERERQKRERERGARDVVHEHDARCAEEAGDDRDLARGGDADAAAEQPVGPRAAEHDADRRGDVGERRRRARLERRQSALLHEIRREPGEQEVERRHHGELAQSERPHLALAQQSRDLRARHLLARRHLRQRAARRDQRELLGVGARALTRLAIHGEPDDRADDARDPSHPEHRAPPVRVPPSRRAAARAAPSRRTVPTHTSTSRGRARAAGTRWRRRGC